MAFPDVWTRIQSLLAAGTVVRNWTQASGHIGDDFRITEVVQVQVTVDAPGAQNLQRIPRQDFERVYDVWADYVLGLLPRHDLGDITQYSKYIISIYRSLQHD